MSIRVTQQDMESVYSELARHKEQPIQHPNCEFCDWLREFSKLDEGQSLAEDSRDSVEYIDRLFFLYCGVRIGRKQGVDDLIDDMDKQGMEISIPPRKDPEDD